MELRRGLKKEKENGLEHRRDDRDTVKMSTVRNSSEEAHQAKKSDRLISG